jgi:pyrimidine-nucleoside phosphorylase
MDVRAIGAAAVALGAGRSRLDDEILPGVGFDIRVRPGDPVDAGQAVATVFAADEEAAAHASEALLTAIRIGAEAEPLLPLVSHRITADGIETLQT